MPAATVNTKGQITIPAAIRKAISLSAHDRVVFTLLDDGTVVMRAKNRSILDLHGLLQHPDDAKAVTIDAMGIGRDEC